ncbi:MAG: surface lipoprotein assembly modifier [Alteripontixanthobacter sp.]
MTSVTAETGLVQEAQVSPAQLFEIASAAIEKGNLDFAERALRALAKNPDVEIRTEARFRLAMLLADSRDDAAGAAILLRQILDEKPEAQRVRLELARMQAQMGNMRAARRELRAASAGGLPPEVEQLVRFYAAALNARRPVGASLRVAIAPDSNINRATTSDSLETIIGDFDLDEDANAQSGIGLSVQGQAFARQKIDSRATLVARANISSRLYEKGRFNDVIASFLAGPQYSSGRDTISFAGSVSHRWFGGDPYSFGFGVSGNWRHPMGERTQLSVDGALIYTDDRQNDLRDAERLSLAAQLDRAFTQKAGGGLRVSTYREFARDPGNSEVGAGVSAFAYREIGSTTAVARAGYNRLEADERLFLFPERRVDDRFNASINVTLRALRVGRFAPVVGIRYELAKSTIEIYDYQRVAAEFGITAAF